MSKVVPTPPTIQSIPTPDQTYVNSDPYDLTSLLRDPEQNYLYDLTQITFNNKTATFFQYVVQPHEEMRIDLISNELYGSLQYVDFLLDINDIDNPLNIKSGDTLKYVDSGIIAQFQVSNSTQGTQTQQTLLNTSKATQTNQTRQQFLQNNYSLPPTFLNNPQPSVVTVGNTIIVGGSIQQ